ncbi:DM7 family protein GE17493 [Scaptodrosophila lebanonensis]|uniref:DM7 family protein GE17493 n=1 Tax=Drosophila lebanonensis TaxID=7225 RepID=A0A6J2TS31_DROLE|nr:DM7 family protein GE17493 [Scaptodrosophila lebanonensis]
MSHRLNIAKNACAAARAQLAGLKKPLSPPVSGDEEEVVPPVKANDTVGQSRRRNKKKKQKEHVLLPAFLPNLKKLIVPKVSDDMVVMVTLVPPMYVHDEAAARRLVDQPRPSFEIPGGLFPPNAPLHKITFMPIELLPTGFHAGGVFSPGALPRKLYPVGMLAQQEKGPTPPIFVGHRCSCASASHTLEPQLNSPPHGVKMKSDHMWLMQQQLQMHLHQHYRLREQQELQMRQQRQQELQMQQQEQHQENQQQLPKTANKQVQVGHHQLFPNHVNKEVHVFKQPLAKMPNKKPPATHQQPTEQQLSQLPRRVFKREDCGPAMAMSLPITAEMLPGFIGTLPPTQNNIYTPDLRAVAISVRNMYPLAYVSLSTVMHPHKPYVAYEMMGELVPNFELPTDMFPPSAILKKPVFLPVRYLPKGFDAGCVFAPNSLLEYIYIDVLHLLDSMPQRDTQIIPPVFLGRWQPMNPPVAFGDLPADDDVLNVAVAHLHIAVAASSLMPTTPPPLPPPPPPPTTPPPASCVCDKSSTILPSMAVVGARPSAVVCEQPPAEATIRQEQPKGAVGVAEPPSTDIKRKHYFTVEGKKEDVDQAIDAIRRAGIEVVLSEDIGIDLDKVVHQFRDLMARRDEIRANMAIPRMERCAEESMRLRQPNVPRRNPCSHCGQFH